jgi:hypothetical protein
VECRLLERDEVERDDHLESARWRTAALKTRGIENGQIVEGKFDFVLEERNFMIVGGRAG